MSKHILIFIHLLDHLAQYSAVVVRMCSAVRLPSVSRTLQLPRSSAAAGPLRSDNRSQLTTSGLVATTPRVALDLLDLVIIVYIGNDINCSIGLNMRLI